MAAEMSVVWALVAILKDAAELGQVGLGATCLKDREKFSAPVEKLRHGGSNFKILITTRHTPKKLSGYGYESIPCILLYCLYALGLCIVLQDVDRSVWFISKRCGWAT